ncbi:RNase adapter RapZ [Bacillus licheniformis]|nr:RNase adapter RapZ [Bacillus licheniformis]
MGKHPGLPREFILDAKDSVLVSRYKETRRSHPLATTGLPLEGIQTERELLEELKGRSQIIYDTSDMKPKDLRENRPAFAADHGHTFTVNVMSFGFKYGLPIDADLVFDVRFLPNPYYIDSMRPLTGKDQEVSSYVMKWNETQSFLKIDRAAELYASVIQARRKSQLVIAIGCTGGQHRSVTLAEYLADYLKGLLYSCYSPGHREESRNSMADQKNRNLWRRNWPFGTAQRIEAAAGRHHGDCDSRR